MSWTLKGRSGETWVADGGRWVSAALTEVDAACIVAVGISSCRDWGWRLIRLRRRSFPRRRRWRWLTLGSALGPRPFTDFLLELCSRRRWGLDGSILILPACVKGRSGRVRFWSTGRRSLRRLRVCRRTWRQLLSFLKRTISCRVNSILRIGRCFPLRGSSSIRAMLTTSLI